MTDVKKILITTEQSEFFIVRTNARSDVRGFCSDCGSEVPLLTLDQTVDYTGEVWRKLIGQIETGAIHSLDTVGGHLLLCQNSLQDFFKAKNEKIEGL